MLASANWFIIIFEPLYAFQDADLRDCRRSVVTSRPLHCAQRSRCQPKARELSMLSAGWTRAVA